MTDTSPEQHHLTRAWFDPEAFHGRIRNDPVFAAELKFCCDHGIPHSIFLGRVWPAPWALHEPQWSTEDRLKAVAYTMWSQQLCQGCGLHPLDWANEEDETHEGVVSVCWGCQELADTTAKIPDDVKPQRRQAMRASLRRRAPNETLLLEARDRGLIPDED